MSHTILSFTSMPDRIHYSRPMVESILNQSVQPDEIILWLSKRTKRTNEVMNYEKTPSFIINTKIKIFFTEDCGPNTKFLPSLNYAKGANTMIITGDDDTIYPKDWLKNLIEYANHHPDVVVGYRGKIFKKPSFKASFFPFNLQRSPKYKKAKTIIPNNLKEALKVDVLTGVLGVLYRKKFFDNSVFDMKCCPRAFYNDDLWNCGHLAKKGIERHCIGINQPFEDIPMETVDRLWDSVNRKSGHNDVILKHFKKYW